MDKKNHTFLNWGIPVHLPWDKNYFGEQKIKFKDQGFQKYTLKIYFFARKTIL